MCWFQWKIISFELFPGENVLITRKGSEACDLVICAISIIQYSIPDGPVLREVMVAHENKPHACGYT